MRILPFDYAVRNLLRSAPRLFLAVAGSMIVVLLLLSAGGFVRGMDLSLRSSGEPDNVILVGTGSEESIERSEVDASVSGLVTASISGIRSRAGVDYVSPEVHVQLPVHVSNNRQHTTSVLVRGVTPAATLVHASMRIVEGQFPRAGFNELMIGSMLETRLATEPENLAVGKSLSIDGREWKIVGKFSAPGTVMEAEAWTALTDLKEATKRTTDSCVILTLDREVADFADVATFTKMRVDLELASLSESQYYERLSSFFAPIRFLAWITAGLIALGGLFGGLNTMYAAFASRVRELGTLQACGFRKGAIVLSLVQESLLASIFGALLACGIAVLMLDGVAIRFSMGVFGLRVDAVIVAIGLCAGFMLGLVGALPPAWRCLRLEIPVALKSV